MKYVIESEAGRLWGPFKSAASADRWAKATLAHVRRGVLNAYKIRVLHPSR